MRLLLYFSSVGEWIADNILGIVMGISMWLITSAGIIWRFSRLEVSLSTTNEKMEDMKKTQKELSDDVYDHVGSDKVHTTLEQRQAFNERMDKLENKMDNGHLRIEQKIDKLAEFVYKQ